MLKICIKSRGFISSFRDHSVSKGPFSILLVCFTLFFLNFPCHADGFKLVYDFTASNPFQYWTSNGDYKIHDLSIVPSTDPARGNVGKFDIELIDARYVYLSIPARVPLDGSLKLSGDIRVTRTHGASVAIGTNIATSPVRRSGVYMLNALEKPSTWKTQSANVGYAGREKASKLVDRYFHGVTVDDVGVWLDKIGVFVRGKPGGRIIFEIDNVRLEGQVPEKERYAKERDQTWAASCERVRQSLQELASLTTPTATNTVRSNLHAARRIRSATDAILDDFNRKGFVSPEAFERLLLYVETAKQLASTPARGLTVYPWEPTSPIPILPNTYPLPASSGKHIAIQACRGEYEPASFILRSSHELPYLTITANDLRNASGHVIPKAVVDIHLVKCWFQAGSGDLRQKRTKTLVPELLVKDNDLVRVDLEKKTNALRGFQNGKIQYFDITHPKSKVPAGAVISDSNVLEPFDLPADFNQQIWITVKIPEDAENGNYQGHIAVRSMGQSLAKLEFNVNVLPFELPPPALDYAIYYRGKLVPSKKASIGSEYKSETQYRLEMADLKAHGIDSPTLYQPYDNLLDRALDIRQQADLSRTNLFILGVQTKPPFNPVKLAKLEKKVRKWKALSELKGYQHLYVYGIDEAKDDLIVAQLPAWRIVKANGGRVFVACPHHADTLANSFLDLGVLNGPLDPSTAARWSNSGLKIFSYSNPQVGLENPSVYRSNFGFNLWAAGYAGAMNYAYQHAFGDIWNDFDHSKFRDHVFAYPVSNGLIGTIQWEGFREAIDDIRYLAAALSIGSIQTESEWLQKFVSDINNDSPSSMLRQSAIKRITGM